MYACRDAPRCVRRKANGEKEKKQVYPLYNSLKRNKKLTDLVIYRPNGTPRKLLDVSKAKAMGWEAKTSLDEGIRLAYEDFLHNPMRAER